MLEDPDPRRPAEAERIILILASGGALLVENMFYSPVLLIISFLTKYKRLEYKLFVPALWVHLMLESIFRMGHDSFFYHRRQAIVSSVSANYGQSQRHVY